MKKLLVVFLLVLVLTSVVCGEPTPMEYEFGDAKNVNVFQPMGLISRQLQTAAKYSRLFIFIYKAESLNGENPDIVAREKFLQLELDKKGTPLLNLLIFYSAKEKILRIAYAEECGWDKEYLENLSKDIAKEINISNNNHTLYLFDAISDIKEKARIKIKEGLVCNFKTDYTEVRKSLAKKDECKSVYDGDGDAWEKRRILFLGSGFKDEDEFKKWIKDNAIEKGFMEIQPFKKYTGNGKDETFQFVYGVHDLKLEYNKLGFANSDSVKSVTELQRKCSNVYYTAILDKNWDKRNGASRAAGYYSPDYNFGFSMLSVNTLMHEFGHHFKLDDEYVYGASLSSASNVRTRGTLCSKDPVKDWTKYFTNITTNFSFKGCTFSTYNRSSKNSIMRGTSWKFNYLSCLFIVTRLEKDDSAVFKICKKMYDDFELAREEKPDCLDEIKIGSDYVGNEVKLDKDALFCKNGYRISKDNFTLDCQEHTLTTAGDNYEGINIRSMKNDVEIKNVEIKNCKIKRFVTGIDIMGANGLRISNTDLRFNEFPLVFYDSNSLNLELLGREDY